MTGPSEPAWTDRPLFTDTTPWTVFDIARELEVPLVTVQRWAIKGRMARAADKPEDGSSLPKQLPPPPLDTVWLTDTIWVVQTDRPRRGDRYALPWMTSDVPGLTYELVDMAQPVQGASSRWLATVRLVHKGDDGLPGELGSERTIELVCPLTAPRRRSVEPRWAAGEVRAWAARWGRIDLEGRPRIQRPVQPPRWNGGAILGWGAGLPAPRPPDPGPPPPRG